MSELNPIIKKLIDGNCDNPVELSKDLLIMSANYYNVGKAVTEAEIKYAAKWQELRSKHESDKQCDMGMKTEPEYMELENKKNGLKTLIEVIRSAKKRLTILQDEASLRY